MEKKRIIPKLEIKNEHLIKGIQYEGLRVVGDPKEFALKYYRDGADQLFVTDIVASLYSRENLFKTIENLSENIFIPITAGGGIKTNEDIKNLLNSGADRVSLNSILFEKMEVISDVLNYFGSQFLTIMIEAKKIDNNYYCMKNHGRENTGITVNKWLDFLLTKDFGELAVFSVDNDGMPLGPDKELLDIINSKITKVPIIYGGGINKLDQISEIIKLYNLSGISLGSSLHFNKFNIEQIKKLLKLNNININEF